MVNPKCASSMKPALPSYLKGLAANRVKTAKGSYCFQLPFRRCGTENNVAWASSLYSLALHDFSYGGYDHSIRVCTKRAPESDTQVHWIALCRACDSGQ